MVAGLAITMLSLVYVAFGWYRLASAGHVPKDAGAADSLSFYRRELERQRDARRGNWRRWLPSVVPGLITVSASFVLELNRTPWALVAFEAILIVGGAFPHGGFRRAEREAVATGNRCARCTHREGFRTLTGLTGCTTSGWAR